MNEIKLLSGSKIKEQKIEFMIKPENENFNRRKEYNDEAQQ